MEPAPAPRRGPSALAFVATRPVAITMAMVAIGVFGLVSLAKLPMDLLPAISYPTLTVRTAFPGAAPEDVEDRLSTRVGEALSTLPGLVRSSSISRAGFSDVLLELGHFLPGLGAFLTAHVAYLSGFCWDRWAPKFLRGVPAFAYGLVVLAVVGGGLGDLFAPVLGYVVVICAMLWRAAARLRLPVPSAAQVAGLVGAVLFAGSDTVIAIDRFTDFQHEATRFVVIGTYWAGQLGIALSVPRED